MIPAFDEKLRTYTFVNKKSLKKDSSYFDLRGCVDLTLADEIIIYALQNFIDL